MIKPIELKKPRDFTKHNPMVESFGERVGTPMSTAKEMMAYIVFGDPQHKGGFYGETTSGF